MYHSSLSSPDDQRGKLCPKDGVVGSRGEDVGARRRGLWEGSIEVGPRGGKDF